MSKILCVVNNKGGVGKTHTVFHLAGAFADAGLRVLVVDLDAQANLTRLFLEKIRRPTGYDVLVDQAELRHAAHLTLIQNLDIVPADARLNRLGYALQNQPDQHIRLDTAIHERQQQENPYDVVLLDCPPNLDAHTTNALCAADGVIIAMEADQFSVDGLQQLFELIQQMQRVNRRLVVEGILISSVQLAAGDRADDRQDAARLGRRAHARRPHQEQREVPRVDHRPPAITHYKPGRSEQAAAFEKLARTLIPDAPRGSKLPQGATLAYAKHDFLTHPPHHAARSRACSIWPPKASRRR